MALKKRVIAEDEEVVVYRNGKKIVVVDKVEGGEEAPSVKTPKKKPQRKG